MIERTGRKTRIHFAASPKVASQQAARRLREQYGDCPAAEADVIVALGGDGFMLETVHSQVGRMTPIFGMNFGSVGFLMNDFSEGDLVARIIRAKTTFIHPLRARGRDVRGRPFNALAFNEVSLLRETRQSAKLKVTIDDKERLDELVGDGVLVATPAGSTAYNLSAHGPILPLASRLLALTPLSVFRPRRWRGALLPHTVSIRFDVLEPDKRPVSAVADNQEFRDVAFIEIAEDPEITIGLLFDEDRDLDERILAEQFTQ